VCVLATHFPALPRPRFTPGQNLARMSAVTRPSQSHRTVKSTTVDPFPTFDPANQPPTQSAMGRSSVKIPGRRATAVHPERTPSVGTKGQILSVSAAVAVLAVGPGSGRVPRALAGALVAAVHSGGASSVFQGMVDQAFGPRHKGCGDAFAPCNWRTALSAPGDNGLNNYFVTERSTSFSTPSTQLQAFARPICLAITSSCRIASIAMALSLSSSID